MQKDVSEQELHEYQKVTVLSSSSRSSITPPHSVRGKACRRRRTMHQSDPSRPPPRLRPMKRNLQQPATPPRPLPTGIWEQGLQRSPRPVRPPPAPRHGPQQHVRIALVAELHGCSAPPPHEQREVGVVEDGGAGLQGSG